MLYASLLLCSFTPSQLADEQSESSTKPPRHERATPGQGVPELHRQHVQYLTENATASILHSFGRTLTASSARHSAAEWTLALLALQWTSSPFAMLT